MNRYALVIGISEYQSPIKTLSKTANDAAAVATVLEQFGDFRDVEVLKGSVTHTEVITALRNFLRDRAVRSDALIYFTGHGVSVVDPVIGKPKAYLATSDTIVTLEGKQSIEVRRAVPLDSLNDLIEESNLCSLIMLFDSCHSGDFLERSLVEKTFTAFSTGRDSYLITACRGFEQAYAKTREEHSIFTAALLTGLSQSNANESGQVTGDRLFECIARELRDSGQEPIRIGMGQPPTLVRYPTQLNTRAVIVDAYGEVICPYQGLEAFTLAQQEFFFGRKRIVEAIKQKLEQQPFVPVIGASGSGKSSVVRAGLMPWLEERGWQILGPIKPGFVPLVNLRNVFEPFFERSGSDIQTLHKFIAQDSTGLSSIIDRLTGEHRYLLVVDQFEEVFAGCADETERERFIELLTQVSELQDSRLAVVTTMRTDFLESCLRYPSLSHLIQSQAVFMPPLTGMDLRNAIIEPAKRQGYTVEEALLLQILEDGGKEPGYLPLLQSALTKLWENRNQEKRLLTLEQYETLGGLTGTLNLHAEQIYHYRDYEAESSFDLRSEQEQEWIKQIFLRLVRFGGGGSTTRQRQLRSTLLEIVCNAPEERAALDESLISLVQGRLLVIGQDSLDEEPWIDLAHEALIHVWSRYQKWIHESKEVLKSLQRVEEAAKEWQQSRQEDLLLVEGRLSQAVELLKEGYLSTSTQKFVQISIQKQDFLSKLSKLKQYLTACRSEVTEFQDVIQGLVTTSANSEEFFALIENLDPYIAALAAHPSSLLEMICELENSKSIS